jgi:chromosomal replication initiator protein
MVIDDLWQNCLQNIKPLIPLKDFVAWISVLKIGDSEQNKLRLVAHNSLVYSFVKKKFWSLIQQEFAKISSDYEILLVLQNDKQSQQDSEVEGVKKAGSSQVRKNASVSVKQYQSTKLSSEYKFTNLVCGKANHVAYSLGSHIVKDLGNKSHNPFFIYGKVGLGKTHLMQAIGNQIFDTRKDLQLRYLHINEYIQDIMNAAVEHSFAEMRKYYYSLDVLLVDDIQFLVGANKQKSQEEFVQIINYFLDKNKQIVVTCDTNPQNLGDINSRLMSRLNSGVAIEINPPDVNMRMDILRTKAASQGIIVSDDALFFIAQSVKSNVRELEGALNKVLYHAKFSRCAVTLSLVQEALSDSVKRTKIHEITVVDIQKFISDYFNIKLSELLSNNRSKVFAIPRQYAMALSKELTTASLPSIGNAFGGRDHTTVLYAYRKINDLRKTDKEVSKTYKLLLDMLKKE